MCDTRETYGRSASRWEKKIVFAKSLLECHSLSRCLYLPPPPTTTTVTVIDESKLDLFKNFYRRPHHRHSCISFFSVYLSSCRNRWHNNNESVRKFRAPPGHRQRLLSRPLDYSAAWMVNGMRDLSMTRSEPNHRDKMTKSNVGHARHWKIVFFVNRNQSFSSSFFQFSTEEKLSSSWKEPTTMCDKEKRFGSKWKMCRRNVITHPPKYTRHPTAVIGMVVGRVTKSLRRWWTNFGVSSNIVPHSRTKRIDDAEWKHFFEWLDTTTFRFFFFQISFSRLLLNFFVSRNRRQWISVWRRNHFRLMCSSLEVI